MDQTSGQPGQPKRQEAEARFLAPDQVRRFYDRLGRGQDWQRFYEGPAIARLLQAGDFSHARSVFEFGAGTGALAARLLREVLPQEASYLAVDISSTMVGLTRARLRPFGDRAQVVLTQGEVTLPVPDRTIDRFVATYVLDLLPPDAIGRLIDDAFRALAPNGLLCLISLTDGRTIGGRAVTAAWRALYRLNPLLVGGCRPLRLRQFVTPPRWRLLASHWVSAFGITSEVVVAAKASPAAVEGQTPK